ncbi:hypothetical protein D9M68_728290 [compost metagenome]
MPFTSSRLPPMPALITDTACAACGLSRNRVASMSGYEPSPDSPPPAVIESPNATTVRTGRAVSTSSPVTMWLIGSAVAFDSRGDATTLPLASQPVSVDSRYIVANGVARSRKRLTAKAWPAATFSATPSLHASAPGATVTVARPPKRSVRNEAGEMASPPVPSATVAAAMRSGVLPKRFDTRTRMRSPSIVGRIIWRKVWPRNTWSPGPPMAAVAGFASSSAKSSTATAQLATQRASAGWRAACSTFSAHTACTPTSNTARPRTAIQCAGEKAASRRRTRQRAGSFMRAKAAQCTEPPCPRR